MEAKKGFKMLGQPMPPGLGIKGEGPGMKFNGPWSFFHGQLRDKDGNALASFPIILRAVGSVGGKISETANLPPCCPSLWAAWRRRLRDLKRHHSTGTREL
jgi:hypothetical protein